MDVRMERGGVKQSREHGRVEGLGVSEEPRTSKYEGLMYQDWTKIYTQLGLGKETLTSLQAFRARHSSASNRNAALKTTAPQLDLSQYKSVLRDQRAVEEAEKVLSGFKPVTYDVKRWDDVVDAFEGKAVCSAAMHRRMGF